MRHAPFPRPTLDLCGLFLFSVVAVLPLSHALAAPGPVFVALYADEGVWEDGLVASEAMWAELGVMSERITAADIRAGILTDFDVLEMPGGWAGSYEVSLEESGLEAIREFVSAGGGYIGICAGAYLASARVLWENRFISYNLDLVRVVAVGPINAIAPWPDYAMTAVDYQPHPISYGLPDPSQVLYYGGAFFRPASFSDVSIISVYLAEEVQGRAAMVSGECGLGRVFLTAVHPEIEEGSSIDGVTGWDELLNDPESDWPLMAQALAWLVE